MGKKKKNNILWVSKIYYLKFITVSRVVYKMKRIPPAHFIELGGGVL